MRIKILIWTLVFLLFFDFSSSAEADVYLSLEPSSKSVAAGNQFTLDMILSNAASEQLSALNVWLSFEPAYLEVIDADNGNWITDGINVLDAPYHSAFNWDFHGHNAADNIGGTIGYGEESLVTDVSGNGTFAQINFLAKAPVSSTQINYVITGTAGVDDTYVTDLSANNILEGTHGASVNVIPEPATLILLISGITGTFWLGRIEQIRRI